MQTSYFPKQEIPYIPNQNQKISQKPPYDPNSICNICGECIECNKCIEFNDYLQSSNISNTINNYKLQLFNKDKTIMNYSKQLSEQNKKFELMENSLKIKDNQIANLEKALNDLSTQMENMKNENIKNNELIEKYKYQIETQIQQSEHNQTIYDNNFSTMSNRLEENKSKINELEEINNRLTGDLNILQKEIFSKNEIIENKNILNKKLSSENKNLSLLNKKIRECEKKIKELNEEKISLQKYNNELISDNKNLNEKLNQVLQESNQKENNNSIEIYNINSKLTEAEKDLKNTLEELDKNKMDKEALIKNQEKYYNFVNENLNNLNDFIIKAFNNVDINELSQGLKNLNSLGENKFNYSTGDIKYELVENAILEMKKNILKFILNTIEKNDQYINEYNLISRDKDMLKVQNNEIINQLNEYKQNQNEIENKNNEIANNYEKLKESYTKLYNDYNVFTNTNVKYVDDIQQFFLELIQQIDHTLGINNNNLENSEKSLDDVLRKKIHLLIKEYEMMILKIRENDQKDEITYNKIIEMEKLLDESHNVGKMFEEENRDLKQEIERLNYRYNLLKASIDTVENKIKIGDF